MYIVHQLLKVVFCKTCLIYSTEALLEYLVEEENWNPKFLVDACLL